MNKYSFIRLFLMLALLIPIGLIAAWGASHSRPNHAWHKLYAKNENVYVLGKHFLRQDSMLTCLDANTGKFHSIRFLRHNEPYPWSVGFDGAEFWTMDRNRTVYFGLYAYRIRGWRIDCPNTPGAVGK